MSSLSAKPGYNEALAQKDALKAQVDALLDQRDAAAREFGIESQQAQQYQQQASALSPQYLAAIDRLQVIIASPSPDLASPTVTTGQSQSTPATNPREDGPQQAPTQGGVGAGTSNNASASIGADNNTRPTQATIAANVSTAALNQLIPTQPNQLDQYGSYTYSLGWYLLSPAQFNGMMRSGKPNVSGWQLLMQSGGAPIAGRSPAFPDDYYMDDLEITTKTPLGGTGLAHTAVDLRFKVTEPNGITLIENLFQAVQSVYGSAQQAQTSTQGPDLVGESYAVPGVVAKSPTTTKTVNYLQAQYCLVIQFFGYDSSGNLIAPATGSLASGATATSQSAVIVKYYPFRLVDIRFQLANRAVEYTITAKPVGQSYGFVTDRGTVPFPFTMTGETVEQLLNGPKISVPADSGARTSQPVPNNIATFEQQSAIIDASQAQTDANGNFTGETTSPFNVVAP
jgi:hypothetical protein